jgi:GNAT superfamily N-acetyltransferase
MTALIRRCGPADAEAIASVHVRSWRNHYASFVPAPVLAALDELSLAERWEARLADQPTATEAYAAMIGSRLAGFAVIGPAVRLTGPPTSGELFCFYMDPDVWSATLPARLMRTCLRSLLARRLEPVRLWVMVANQHARQFFESVGFAPDDDVDSLRVGNAELPVMRYRWHGSPAAPSATSRKRTL